ncbi:hypothetical protein CR970_01670 [Candidatus Saccharibacteria bacterium]|nr:MAG: hypothetical protein CR970_01670 [Candidatus Saccharibacteria bacterium]
MQNPELLTLHNSNPDLHRSKEVDLVVDYVCAGGEAVSEDPTARLAIYIGFLASEDCVNDGILTGDPVSAKRQVEAHIIKRDDIPAEEVEWDYRITDEQGSGKDARLETEKRDQLASDIQKAQRTTLNSWAGYLGSEEGGYPDWFKYYAWEGVVRLGGVDEKRQSFHERDSATTAPYPVLDRAALAKVYTMLTTPQMVGESAAEGPQDEVLQGLLKSGDFGGLYAYALSRTALGFSARRRRGFAAAMGSQGPPSLGVPKIPNAVWGASGKHTGVSRVGKELYVVYPRKGDGGVVMEAGDGRVARAAGCSTSKQVEDLVDELSSKRESRRARQAADRELFRSLEQKITVDPEAELTGDELRCLYELDREVVGFSGNRDPLVDTVLEMRERRDEQALARVLPEVIRSQSRSSFAAYSSVCEVLNNECTNEGGPTAPVERLSYDEFEHLLQEKLHGWLDRGVYDYLAKELVENNVRHRLVVTPNITVSGDWIVALAKGFGDARLSLQPTEVYDDMYRAGVYTDQQWSGSEGDDQLRFSLMPDACSADLGCSVAIWQRCYLRYLQQRRPELRLRVPSVFDAVAYWYTLRAMGVPLDDANIPEKTYIRHLGYKPRQIDGKYGVPATFIDNSGLPVLGVSASGLEDNARIAVG